MYTFNAVLLSFVVGFFSGLVFVVWAYEKHVNKLHEEFRRKLESAVRPAYKGRR